MLLSYSRRDFLQIGQLLSIREPDIASALYSDLRSLTPHDKDFTRIPLYLDLFKKEMEVADITLKQRRVFIACTILIYDPNILRHFNGMPYSFNQELAKAIGANRRYLSKLISEIVWEYQKYDDFRDQVDNLVVKMKGGVHAQ